jgi:hypothetical protein
MQILIYTQICIGGPLWRAPIFGPTMFMFTRQGPMMDTLLNAEYEWNPSNPSVSSGGHILTERGSASRNYLFLFTETKTCKTVNISGSMFSTSYFPVHTKFSASGGRGGMKMCKSVKITTSTFSTSQRTFYYCYPTYESVKREIYVIPNISSERLPLHQTALPVPWK